MFIREIYHSLFKDEVKAIQCGIEAAVTSDRVPRELRSALLEASGNGRRFRPLLMIVTHKCCGGQWRDILPLACAIELLHKASLVHDDLVDGDSHRRGRPTLWRQFGHREALILGDLLIGIAFHLVATWVPTRSAVPAGAVMEIFAQTLTEAAIGEWLDLNFESVETPDTERLKQMTILKSGVLIAAGMQIGAITGGARQDMQTTMKTLGMELGFIFQTMNDLNNLNGIDDTSKGASGQDMLLGKKNIVTGALLAQNIDFQAFRSMSPAERAACLAPAVNELKIHIARARQCVDRLPPGELKDIFTSLLHSYDNPWFWMDEDTRPAAVPAG